MEGKKKILISDDPGLLEQLKSRPFRRRIYHLLPIGNGPDLLNALERETPDLVVLDLALPDLEPEVVCRIIRCTPRLAGTPIILLAPAGGEETLERFRLAGCDEAFARPFRKGELESAVRRLLRIPLRSQPRYRARLRILYGSERALLFSGETINLSSGGVLIGTKELLPVDSRVQVEIYLPGQLEPICCQGRVAWRYRPGKMGTTRLPGELGVEFLNLDFRGRDALQAYLELEGQRVED